MMRPAKRLLAGYPHALRLARVVRHPLLYGLGYLYGAYLTVRHVDQYDRFPAIIFRSGLIRLRITKGAGSSLTIRGRLTVAPWQGGRAGSQIALDGDAKVVIDGDFGIGDDIRIGVGEGAQLLIGGKREESASGITFRSVILVHRHLKIGRDCIIAWDTFVTDCDWHPIEGSNLWEPTSIGDHVWIGPGAKILKGASIGADTIVGAQSVVIKGVYPPRSLLAGNKAEVVKSEIKRWRRDIEKSAAEIVLDDA
jgi:acetyltransferase-like isoleucine patch superfamily enzyme